MRLWSLVVTCVLVVAVLAGCGGDVASSVAGALAGEGQGSSTQNVESSANELSYVSAALHTAYEGALPASSQLVLGTFALEGTSNAITPQQAKTLLSLWRVIQSGSVQSDAETNAVLKQIEAAMTADQLAAIAAMQLTLEDLGRWMQEQGIDLAPPSGAAAGEGSFAPPQGMREEEMAAMRATAETGGGFPGGGGFAPGGGEAPGGGGPFGDMSEEDRASMRATAEAGGMTRPGGGAAGGRFGGQLAMLAEQVIELLTERAVD